MPSSVLRRSPLCCKLIDKTLALKKKLGMDMEAARRQKASSDYVRESSSPHSMYRKAG